MTNSTNATAFVTMASLLNFYSTKTLAKALEIVTSICRLIQKDDNDADPSIAYGMLIGQLAHICSMLPPSEHTPEDFKVHHALVGRVLINLTSYARCMLNSEQVRYMAILFVLMQCTYVQ
jgi:hypothetical protein